MALPNGSVITSVATGELHLHDRVAPIAAHVFNDTDLNRTLVSVADICAAGCTTTLTNNDITISHAGEIVARDTKAPTDKLWPITLPIKTTAVPRAAHNVVTHQHNADYVAFTHAAMCSPPVESFGKALRAGFFGNLPRITARMLSDNPPASIATAKGHLNRNRQSQRHRVRVSTAAADARGHTDDSAEQEDAPSQVVLNIIMNMPQRNNSDLTGKVPVCSSTGNNYILISVFNSYIHMEPMPSRDGAQYVAALRRTIEFFRDLGHEVTHQRMDNETSRALERYMQEEGISIQFVPPHNHRANPAERGIQTAKNHLISALAGTHVNFPANLWDKILPQVELTMNLLRPFAADRSISAYEGVFRRKYDFEAHPIAPCGTLVLVHDPPDKRGPFACHGSSGFYLGPALKHHRCFRVHMLVTQTERISDSLAWFPAPLQLPGSSPSELVCAALTDLTAALRVVGDSIHLSAVQAAPFQQLARTATASLRQAVEMFLPPAAATESATVMPVVVHHDAHQQRVEIPMHTSLAASGSGAAQDAVLAARAAVVAPVPVQAPPAAPPAVLAAASTTAPITAPAVAAATIARTQRVESQRPHRERTKPQRYREAAHVIARGEVNQMEYTELAAVVDEFLQSEPPGPEPKALFDEFMAVDLKAICAPITYKETKTGTDRALWRAAESEEIIRLIVESETMRFIQKDQKPRDRIDSYANPQPSIKVKNGIEVRRMRMVYGGNRSDYTGPLAAQTADLTTIKCLFNAAISEDTAKLASADIKDFYLGTKLDRYEYMRITREQLPQDIIDRFKLETFMNKGAAGKHQQDWVMVEIVKGIYGLPQAGRLAQEKLVKHLAQHGYTASDDTSCLFSHTTRPTKFTLVVDDFAIKYNAEADLDHLLDALRETYTITVDRAIKKYVGIQVDFDRAAGTVSLSMPDYVRKALQRFGVEINKRAVDSPLLYTPPSYGKCKQQYAPIDTSRKLNGTEVQRLQQIIGVFLYYARAVDPTMLTALSKFSSLQSRATLDLNDAVDRFLQYAGHWPVAVLVYRASDMRLMVESDASYLSEPEARSRAGGLHYLGNYCTDTRTNQVNGAVECMSTIIKSVVSSAFEAEYAALFLNGQTAQGLRNTLRDLGYPQQATPFISDNACAVGVANRTVKQRRSKAIDMRFHWLRDRVKAGDFTVKWEPGKSNKADYFTKAHPVHHYKAMRSTYVK